MSKANSRISILDLNAFIEYIESQNCFKCETDKIQDGKIPVFCRACNKTLSFSRRNHVDDHVKTRSHKSAIEKSRSNKNVNVSKNYESEEDNLPLNSIRKRKLEMHKYDNNEEQDLKEASSSEEEDDRKQEKEPQKFLFKCKQTPKKVNKNNKNKQNGSIEKRHKKILKKADFSNIKFFGQINEKIGCILQAYNINELLMDNNAQITEELDKIVKSLETIQKLIE